MATTRERSLEERAAAVLREVAEFQDTYFGNRRPRRRRRRNRRKSRKTVS